MSVFPIVIDSQPTYLGESQAPLSIGLMPLGASTVIAQLGSNLEAVTHRGIQVVSDFHPSEQYLAAMARVHPGAKRTLAVADFAAGLCKHEPSDWLLIVDARYWPSRGLDLAPIMAGMFEGPRCATHLIALEENSGGTRDRVEFDGQGLIRRIQRYYDDVTWSVTSGVVCSLVPASSAFKANSAPLAYLSGLRTALAAQGVPSRDIPIRGGVYDLSQPGGLLGATEHALAGTDSGRTVGLHQRAGCDVHPSARLLGSVVLHDNVVVEPNVTIIGPAVVGEGAHVREGAIIAQCVVAPATVVAAGGRERSRVLTSAAGGGAPSCEPVHPGHGEAVGELQTPARLYPKIKAVGEAVLALAGLIVLSPLLALLAILIKLDSRGGIFYGDLREAGHGRVFKCYKFRTMAVGSDARQRELMAANQLDGPQFKLTHDPRVTRVGRWLRATSLDELPQLFNVVMGQMSLVGPRPSPFRENQLCVPWREARLSVRPGITGLWQVCRHSRSGGDFHQWISYDLQYVRHMSFWVDLKIVAATFIALGTRKGHVPLSWIIRGSTDH